MKYLNTLDETGLAKLNMKKYTSRSNNKKSSIRKNILHWAGVKIMVHLVK